MSLGSHSNPQENTGERFAGAGAPGSKVRVHSDRRLEAVLLQESPQLGPVRTQVMGNSGFASRARTWDPGLRAA